MKESNKQVVVFINWQLLIFDITLKSSKKNFQIQWRITKWEFEQVNLEEFNVRRMIERKTVHTYFH